MILVEFVSKYNDEKNDVCVDRIEDAYAFVGINFSKIEKVRYWVDVLKGGYKLSDEEKFVLSVNNVRFEWVDNECVSHIEDIKNVSKLDLKRIECVSLLIEEKMDIWEFSLLNL